MNAFVAHVPWLLPIALLLPGAGKMILQMQAMGAECAAYRLKKTALRKDLFYYLVSPGWDNPVG